MATLYCDSKGDRRFSALYAYVTLKNGNSISIERYYQSVKRDINDNPVAKGAPVHHVIINGTYYPPTILTPLYKRLWVMYFDQNPELLEYAMRFDTFIDRFAGRSINSQAKVIEALVNKKRHSVSATKEEHI